MRALYFIAVPPLEFIEETVVLGEDILKPGGSIEEAFNSEHPFASIDVTDEPVTPAVITLSPTKPSAADDVKLYLLVQRLLNETPLIDG